ncbi:adenylate/guanylate cyclase domain-containing protein [Nocardioides humilatus]|uniref:Adenylate/guanylate cyclase domain-containing protein n=1 Tax=Nocardioides humilatus TaxID=2607660 RepID=A0A5B1LE16_9ACTN|nr:adenylate/guanylate cyclase domain-containing protein [Nocardioides humilatus]KAA1418544.1 adenylate/guanylate cyclase domain-containing protein [Nocardioides humilatus]
MSTARDVRYADSGGLQVAYEVIGNGPLDIVIVTDLASNVDVLHDHVFILHFIEQMCEIGRVIYLDPRGVGLSDPLDRLPPLEEWVDDIRVVLDDLGVEQAAVVGHGYGAQLGLLFAAVHPGRTKAVVSINGYARLRAAPDYPAGLTPDLEAWVVRQVETLWGSGQVLAWANTEPSGAPVGTPELWARVERASATPRRAARRQALSFDIDIRSVLPTIAVPTLVVQSVADRYIRREHADHLVSNIPGARLVELPGGHAPMMTGVVDELADAIAGFLAGASYRRVTDRALMTVAFTDIVDSTRRAAEAGDRSWRSLLELHDAITRHEVEVARGRVVKFTGDGVMASFDGPARAVECVRTIGERLESAGLSIRAGVHTGEVEIRDGDIGGIAVHIASRISALAAAGETLTSSTVRDLVAGSGLVFADRGEHVLKGVPDAWHLYVVA